MRERIKRLERKVKRPDELICYYIDADGTRRDRNHRPIEIKPGAKAIKLDEQDMRL